MREIRTHDCGEAGHPELILRFSNEADEAHVVRWAESVVVEVWGGLVIHPGDRGSFHGWPVTFAAEDGVLAVHADDLSGAAAAPNFVPHLDPCAGVTRLQQELADGHGLLWEPLDVRRSTIAMCPEAVERPFGGALLARSESPAARSAATLRAAGWSQLAGGHASGWHLACGAWEACRGRGAHGAWTATPTAEVLRTRPALAPYLGLPAGAVVEYGEFEDRERIGMQPADVPLDPEWNVLRMSLAHDPTQWSRERFALMHGVKWSALRKDSIALRRRTEITPLLLSPERDPGFGLNRVGIDAIVRQHQVNRVSAVQAAVETLKSGRWELWITARHRDQFPNGTYKSVRAAINEENADLNELGRQLHRQTGRPFFEVIAIVKALAHDVAWFRERAARVAAGGVLSEYE